jgi:short-subunit dehydrogenase
MSAILNKTVLITGATGGLGKEMVHAFLLEGGNLILSDLDSGALDRLATEFRHHGSGRILGCIPADLSGEKGCETLYQEVSKLGEIDILVNNAGIAIMGPFASVPQSKWEKILQINLLTPMRLTHRFLPNFMERKSGHIVNISSVAGLIAVPNLATYSVSKFGIKAFGEALYKEVSPHGIRVTNLYPFFTKTPILDSEQIGLEKEAKVPDIILSEPADVIRDLIKGIKNNTVHVHPGGISKTLDFASRLFPGAVETLSSWMVKIGN